MKKTGYLFALTAICLATLGSLSSCKEKLKEVKGVVTDVETSKLVDSIKSMRIYDGQDTLVFNLKDAEYNNGLMVTGDSVQVNYIKGHGDTLRALLVYVKPTPSKTIDLKKDTTEVLLTK